jgi:RIO-like serine/threonine protein kinase
MSVPADKHLEGNVRNRRVAQSMRALGKGRLPETLSLADGEYHLTQTIKHDFWAVTGFYQRADGRRAVLKMGRTAEFAGIPLEWVGRWLCRREMRFYRKLADLPNVPAILGTVGRTGFVHAFVPGRPLARNKPVPDGFFSQLQDLIGELHRRRIAYVDTNKPENILLGDDGRPHLIDFQISWDLDELGDWLLNRWWLARLQREDFYHILKHKRRMRPDELTDAEKILAEQKSVLIRLHRLIFKPYFALRRRILNRMRERGELMPEGSK